MPLKKGESQKRVTKADKYVAALQTGVSKVEAKRIAGYSENSATGAIDRLPRVRKGLATIEQQRETLSQLPEYSFTGVAKRLVKRAKSASVSDRVQTDNDKALSTLMGYNAPTQMNVKSVGLMMEFKDLSAADLAAIQESFQG